MNLFWVDNDYVTPLNPLSRRLELNDFSLKKCATYEEAIELIAAPDFEEVKIALLDVIVPANTKCLSYAGFNIAHEIIRATAVKRIAFLSVVLRNEVNEYYQAVKDSTPNGVEIKYFDKAMLLEPNVFDDLIKCLKG